MRKDAVILVAEDDEGHFLLFERNLRRAGVNNEIIRFTDGAELLDFLFKRSEHRRREGVAYMLVLDIKMPKTDGVEVLTAIKDDTELKKIPIIVLATADNTKEIDTCHELGCGIYMVKPVEYEVFAQTVRKIGAFLNIVEIPEIGRVEKLAVPK
jgi:CheY-like chemotaxis protein